MAIQDFFLFLSVSGLVFYSKSDFLEKLTEDLLASSANQT